MVEVNPDGLDVQLYVLPETEVAPIAAEFPLHIVDGLPTLAAGIGLTVMVTELDLVHPALLVSVNVYTVVAVGETLGLAAVEV